jgi:hypothetical protein
VACHGAASGGEQHGTSDQGRPSVGFPENGHGTRPGHGRCADVVNWAGATEGATK